MSMSDLLSDVTFFSRTESSYAFLMDGKGRLLMHPFLPSPQSVNDDPIFLQATALETSSQAKDVIDSMLRYWVEYFGFSQIRVVGFGFFLFICSGVKMAMQPFHPLEWFQEAKVTRMVLKPVMLSQYTSGNRWVSKNFDLLSLVNLRSLQLTPNNFSFCVVTKESGLAVSLSGTRKPAKRFLYHRLDLEITDKCLYLTGEATTGWVFWQVFSEILVYNATFVNFRSERGYAQPSRIQVTVLTNNYRWESGRCRNIQSLFY